jgi:hypothetical protein
MCPMRTAEELRSLIQRFSKHGNELEDLCQLATDPRYWLTLNPGLTIASADGIDWDSDEPESGEALQEAIRSYRAHGFLSLSGMLSLSQVNKMHNVVERLRNADWPAVFSFVYDDFWVIGRATKLRRLLTEILHADFRLLTRVWTHYVEAATGNGGWIPHVDHPNEDGHTTSVWIPLSSANLRNGCMYVVKRTAKTDNACKDFPNTDTFTKEQLTSLLKNARALPADAGSILCWDEKILHWGGEFEGGSEPRVSIALEFTVPEFVTAGNLEKLIDPMTTLPSFEMRLRLICWALISYRRFEPMMERFVPLAERLSAGTVRVPAE